MGRYHPADALNVPSLISWARVPLAAAFPFCVHHPGAALLVLLAAGASDVVDGWLARSTGQVTPMGSVIDPITDKIFVLTVVGTLVLTSKLPLVSVLFLSTRELGEAPLVLWYAISRRMRRARTRAPMANWPGKAATVLQFVTVTLAIVGSPLTATFLYGTAVAGTLAALSYWLRALQVRAQTP